MKLFRFRRLTAFILFTVLFSTILPLTMYGEVKLPVTVINGKECFYYKPQSSSETVYGISKSLGITREEIVAYNPSVADGIRKNTILYFPVSDFKDRISVEGEVTRSVEIAEHDNRMKPVNVVPQVIHPNDNTTNVDLREVQLPDYSNSLRPVELHPQLMPNGELEQPIPYRIALLLPYEWKEEASELSRSSKQSADLYRGFLLGASELMSSGQNVTIDAIQIDSENFDFNRSEITDASVVISPESKTFLRKIVDANPKGYVLNALNFSDSLYLTTPCMVHANIPQTEMYRKAINYLVSELNGATPVILYNKQGVNDKENFISQLKKEFESISQEYKEIKYEGFLSTGDLEPLMTGEQFEYVIIPSAGSIAEFNKFAYTLQHFRNNNRLIFLRLFGYPEWLAYRGEAQMLLKNLGATIYSRFNDIYNSSDVQNIQKDFRKWFNVEMIESIPSYGVLGYDLAKMTISNLRLNGGYFEPFNPEIYRGVQTTYEFQQPNVNSGYCNGTLYIIHYTMDERPYVRVL